MASEKEKSIIVRPISKKDFTDWVVLWAGYNTFYKRTIADEITQTTWNRFFDSTEPVYALVAEKDSKLLGFTHYLFHRNTTLINETCYLQDLYTSEALRGQGIGSALIEAVYEKARERGSARVYWQTHESNEIARKLYDKIADYSGFVVYRKLILKGM